MESADENPDLDVASKIAESDPVSDEDVKMNGEVNGIFEEREADGEIGDELAGSPMSEEQTNGEVTGSCHEELASMENGDEGMEVDSEAHDAEDDGDKGEEEETEERFNEGEEDDDEEEEEEEEEEVVDEAEHQIVEGDNNLVVDEPLETDKPGSIDDSQDEDEPNLNDEPLEKTDGDSLSESDRTPRRSESAAMTKEDINELDDSSMEAKDDESVELEKVNKDKPSEVSCEEIVDPTPPRSLSHKSILSNIKGVDCNTPMSKELEDLSKIGARGSLEITLVKKEAHKDKEEDTTDRASAPAILTITDASSKVVLNNDQQTPKKKSDGDDDDDDSVIELSPDKNSAKKKKSLPINVTPRRSSRNLNKTKTYTDKELYQEDGERKADDEDDDVQEVVPTDPLAMADDKNKIKKTTIVVNDTKKLVEIAAGSKQNRTPGKKEPTLVIIDTNSILSGKGAIPITSSLPQMSITPSVRPQNTQSFMRSLNTPATTFMSKTQSTPVPQPQQMHSQPKPIMLPSLTDDMYVVEAPSFIVPYVYEKPPITPLKDYVEDIEKILKEREKEEKERKKAEKEKKKESLKVAIEEDAEKEKASAEKSDEIKEDDCVESGGVVDKSAEVKKEDDPDFKAEIKEDKSDTDTDDDGKDSDNSSKKGSDSVEVVGKKSDNYFENPLGKFFMQIGINLVQEHVQTDLLRTQRRKRDKDEKNCPPEVHKAINSLLKTLEYSKENNKPYKLELQKCQLCNFKTESAMVMAHHLETPHMRNYVYRCNFCSLEVRSPHDILLHMESNHNVRGRLERAPAFHQCPNCPFEDGQKGKLSRHLLSCAKKYKPERNQEPPLDWEPPAKIPRVKGARPGVPGSPLYNSATLVPRGGAPLGRMPTPVSHTLLAPRGRGRPPIYINRGGVAVDGRLSPHHKSLSQLRPGMVFRPTGTNSQPQVLIPNAYNNMYQKSNNSAAMAAAASAGATAKLLQQPSISITPLPRQPSAPAQSNTPAPVSSSQNMPYVAKPGRPTGGMSKTTFVICEICDGYIKDLEQLRNHMQWIHKVKIHPKMIYNRPPLNCQKCQFRFFTDQGLERHLLGSHGLVTSSMQEAANKGKDGGRCPVCGRVYQWKLLNHVARDHNMSLKPAHLSYKCTVCTATFGMYKQFESHVYSAHSVVAKRVMDKKGPNQQPQQQPSTSSSPQSESLLKPLKINDEITIIPQPARAKTKPQQQSAPPQTKPAKVIEF